VKNNLEKAFEKIGQKQQRRTKPKISIKLTRLGALVGAGLSLILSLNVAIYLHTTQVESVRAEKLNQLSLIRAKFAAENIEKYLGTVRKKIQFFARKPTVNAALVLGKDSVVDAALRGLVAGLNGAVAARIIDKDQASLDPIGNPPIRFTELEMIRLAEKREVVLPEAVKINNRWVINFVEPLPYDNSQEVMSVVLVSVATGDLGKNLVADKVSLGEVFLEQQFGSKKPIVVASFGKGTVGDVVRYPVNNSYWYVGFKPSYVMMENARIDTIKVYGLITVIFLALTGAFIYAGRFIGLIIGNRLNARALKAGTAAHPLSTDSAEKGLVHPMCQKSDILDVDIADGDEDLLGLEDAEVVLNSPSNETKKDILDISDDSEVPDVIFRAYDIRGIAKKQITNNLARLVGQALGSEAIDNGQDALIVARDARLSSPELTEFLIRGVLASGCSVVNIGTVPTPLMYFATATLKESQSGVMVTASHNPKQYNGFKVVMNGKSRSDQDIKSIRRRILKNDLYEGDGSESKHDIIPDYVDTIFSDVALAGDVSMVIDASNGVTGLVAPRLFEELGCHVVPLFCDLDGNFPHHEPDPSVAKNLVPLIDKVKETGADLGVIFDGDGDRLVVVTSSGQIIWPDQLLMLFAKDIVSRNPGADVVFDVKSTRHLAATITSYGGRPIMWKTGHAPMKNKMVETGALLGGEYSGHIFIKDRWFGFDDGMYAAARLIEILTLQGESLDTLFDEFPKSPATPEIRVPIDDNTKFDIVAKLAEIGDFGEGRVTNIDGVRVDFPFGWGLVRASNTSPNLTLRFEADDDNSLHKVKSIVVQQLKNVDKTIQINWDV